MGTQGRENGDKGPDATKLFWHLSCKRVPKHNQRVTAPVPPRSHHPQLNPGASKTQHHQSLQCALGLQVPLGPLLLLRSPLATSHMLQRRCFAAALHGEHAAPRVELCSLPGWGPGPSQVQGALQTPGTCSWNLQDPGTAPCGESNPCASGESKTASRCTPTNRVRGCGATVLLSAYKFEIWRFLLHSTCGNSSKQERQQVRSS